MIWVLILGAVGTLFWGFQLLFALRHGGVHDSMGHWVEPEEEPIWHRWSVIRVGILFLGSLYILVYEAFSMFQF